MQLYHQLCFQANIDNVKKERGGKPSTLNEEQKLNILKLLRQAHDPKGLADKKRIESIGNRRNRQLKKISLKIKIKEMRKKRKFPLPITYQNIHRQHGFIPPSSKKQNITDYKNIESTNKPT